MLESMAYAVSMRSYGQYCSIARALDVVGDRWTLLIARELLLQGSCRFTDLKNGLPGIATNLLSNRLKELEEAGLVTREDAPPPVATVLYSLSDSGRALEPVLQALGLFGLRFMAEERADDAFQARWLAYAPEWFVTDADPDGPPAVIQLAAGGELAVIELRDGEAHSRLGRADDPDLVLEGPPRAVLGLVNGLIDLQRAERIGLTATGQRDLLARLRPAAREAVPAR
ncbi:transcriptional regulator, HxlR family [Actinacidiphila guanduensis]|uniref:Transcriptional regulator, HxlR family n=2 Tax=Actinacidiphila guanduensis TaxID=310781 RepID=A0A1H0BEM5_9ACTN|nr:transcriptional regulator, HxlR family [Actinacidiphila guanduensis]